MIQNRVLILLEIVRNKCCARQTAERGEGYLKKLYPLLTENEASRLRTAYIHYSSCWEWSAEFHGICKELHDKYLVVNNNLWKK